MKFRLKTIHVLINNKLQAPKNYVNHIKNDLIVKKLTEANKWYTEFLGLDKIQSQQERVMKLQNKLLDVQERRRDLGHQLVVVHKRSNELQDVLYKINKHEDSQRYLNLTREKIEILKNEIDVSNKFKNCEHEERETFTAYTNAIKDSHEMQRAQYEYNKYFGIILSIFGSFCVFCYSTLRKRDVENCIDERLDKNEVILKMKEIITNKSDDNTVSYLSYGGIKTLGLVVLKLFGY
ncbi:hypothetical protein FQR65_LT00156 [Abscondita terminalis]|nr:hypothetical protein FQR65_LT00156 [Abscondita terminalis]